MPSAEIADAPVAPVVSSTELSAVAGSSPVGTSAGLTTGVVPFCALSASSFPLVFF